MLRAFLWVVIALLSGAIAWLLFFSKEAQQPASDVEPAQNSAVDASSERATEPKPPSGEQLQLGDLLVRGLGELASSKKKGNARGHDVLCLKNGTKHSGKLVSQEGDVVLFQIAGNKEATRFAKQDVAEIRSGDGTTAAAASQGSSSPRISEGEPRVEEEKEKPELYMTAKEWQEHQVKKRQESVDRSRKQGGIRAINIARDIHENAEKREDVDEAIKTSEGKQ